MAKKEKIVSEMSTTQAVIAVRPPPPAYAPRRNNPAFMPCCQILDLPQASPHHPAFSAVLRCPLCQATLSMCEPEADDPVSVAICASRAYAGKKGDNKRFSRVINQEAARLLRAAHTPAAFLRSPFPEHTDAACWLKVCVQLFPGACWKIVHSTPSGKYRQNIWFYGNRGLMEAQFSTKGGFLRGHCRRESHGGGPAFCTQGAERLLRNAARCNYIRVADEVYKVWSTRMGGVCRLSNKATRAVRVITLDAQAMEMIWDINAARKPDVKEYARIGLADWLNERA